MIYTGHLIVLGCKLECERLGMHTGIFMRKSLEKCSLRSLRRWEGNIEIARTKIGHQNRKWMVLD